MLAAGNCLLTDVVDQFHEDTKKINSVERLTRHLNNDTSSSALKSYLTAIRKKIKSKEDVVNIALTYFSRWRIEEYFRCKKADVSV